MNRNYSIDLIKLFFAISIALGHYSTAIIGSGVVVEMFFVLSGYFLVNSFETGKYKSSWHFSYNRVKRIYPYYVFAFFILFLWLNIDEITINLVSVIKDFFKQLPELCFLQNIGVVYGGINYPCWQLGCMLVVSHIMFSLLIWNKQMTLNVICPIIAIAGYTYFANVFGTGEVEWWGVEYKFIYIPILRTMSSMSIGMFFNFPINKIVEKIENSKSKYLPIILLVIEAMAFPVFWLNRGSYAIMLVFIIIIICMLNSRNTLFPIFQSRIFSKVEKLSLALYLNHALIIDVLNKYTKSIDNKLYLTVLIGYSIVMIFTVELLVKLGCKVVERGLK